MLYENDHLVQLDSFLILVESKGGKVSAPASRGAEKSLKDEIRELIVEPSEQSHRFAEYLLQNSGIRPLVSASDGSLFVDTTSLQHVIRINVILEPPGDLQTHGRSLMEAGFVDPLAPLCPTLLLADLEILFEFLNSVPERLDYLRMRASLEDVALPLVDEIDLLGFYITNSFHIDPPLLEDNAALMLFGSSEVIDQYLRARMVNDLPKSKPGRRYTRWWKDLISKLEEKKIPRWTEIAGLLLRVNYEQQVQLEQEISHVKRLVRRDWRFPDHINTIPYGNKDTALAVFVYRGSQISTETRNRMLTNAGKMALTKSEIEAAAVIGIDLDNENHPEAYPYAVLVLVVQDSDCTSE